MSEKEEKTREVDSWSVALNLEVVPVPKDSGEERGSRGGMWGWGRDVCRLILAGGGQSEPVVYHGNTVQPLAQTGAARLHREA